jgi:Fe2+ or Zn2+ uptake regulation protein
MNANSTWVMSCILHLVCQSCGQAIGVDLALAEPLAEQLKELHGLALDLDHLLLPGLCRACVVQAHA